MMEVPQLHGFGPAANRLLEAYKMLWKVYQHHFMFFMLSSQMVAWYRFNNTSESYQHFIQSCHYTIVRHYIKL
jgi:hypothetical protein